MIILLCLGSPSVRAQKVFKPLRAAFKAKKPADVLTEVRKIEPECPEKMRPKLYAYAVEANVQLNDQQNEKIYLKQAYDTVQFFRTIYGIYDNVLRCDSAERRLLARVGGEMHYQKPHGQLLRKYYRNLVAGGRFYFTRGRYAEAIPFLRYAVDVPQMPVWGNEARAQRGHVRENCGVMLVRSAFLTKDYELVRRYAEAALEDTTASRRSIVAYLARTEQLLGDTVAYVGYLRRGMEEYSAEPFFFTELVDHYASRGDYATTLSLADRMLPTDSTNYYFLMAKALSLMNLERNREAVNFFGKALEADSTHADTYYYIGASYCNLAKSTVLPANITSADYKAAQKTRRDYYLLARTPLETYRQLRPADAVRWAPLLYDIYFTLNQGERFAEMDEIMRGVRTPETNGGTPRQ
ncbi:MAG: hypothetical protein IJ659_08740 [Alloprevotella sp.]|nr:hypothetical protein [Alloprevotella sp.]